MAPVSTRKTFLFACALVFAAARGHSQSLSGIEIGDPFTVTQRIGFPPSRTERAGPFTVAKWKLADGNSLSVTARSETGKIVYIETDWGESTTYTDFPDFYFGKTTLSEIKNKLGTDNFAWNGGPMADGSIDMLNSYRVSGTNVIVTFATKISKLVMAKVRAKKIQTTASNIDNLFLLNGLILGDPDYLSSIWGNEHLPAGSADKSEYTELRGRLHSYSLQRISNR
jgi:hypothetical protein